MSFSKNNKLKKMVASFLMVVMLITTFAILPVSAASGNSNTVYPGGKIKATVEFAKDIPEGVPCYLFELEYDGSSLSYSETENHWALNPLTVPHPDWDQPALSCSAFTAVGPEVKAGEKIVSFTFDVTKEINADELSFSYAEFQLYNNDATRLDSSYFVCTVEVLSFGSVPTEPVPTEPTPTEPVPTEPTPTEPTPTEPTPTEPVPTEPTPTEPTPTEPAETDPTTPDVTPTVPGESTDATSATGATTDGTSTSDTPSGGNNNGAVQTGNASMALVILLVLVSASAVLFFTRKRVR